MKESQIASEIDYEYRMRKKYEEKRAKRCKNKVCGECELWEICTEGKVGEECGKVKMGTS